MERARRDYPHLFPEHWPFRREDVRPWLEDPSLLAIGRVTPATRVITSLHPKPGDRVAVEVDAKVLQTGQVVTLELLARLTGLAAAGLSTAAMLDLTDGRLDHAIRWCHVLQEVQRFLA